MSNDKVFQAWINPLAFLEVDEPWAKSMQQELNLEAFLKYLCTPGIGSDLDSLTKRYQEISTEPKRLIAAPLEEQILNKLVWPLRHAKGSYILGNYLGTIALCGMVVEMVSILIFEISDIHINNKLIDESTEGKLFGRSFEKLGQERRVAVLHGFNLIDDEMKSLFDIVRQKRNKYLHFYSQDHAQLAPDAVEVFNTAVTIVVKVIGQDLQDGRLILNPKLLKYLEDKGIVKTDG